MNPEKLYGRAAQDRCEVVADAVVAMIQVEAETPEDTHRLEHGYRVRRDGTGAEIYNDDAPYWIYQEFGTRTMRARPHVRPAVEYVRLRGVP